MVEHYENTWTLTGRKIQYGWIAKGIEVNSVVLPTVIALDYTADFRNTGTTDEPVLQTLSTFSGWSGSSNEPGHGESNTDNYFSDGNINFNTADNNLTTAGRVSAGSTETKRVGGNIRFSKNEQEFGNTYLNPSMTYGFRTYESNNGNIEVVSNDISIEIKIIGRKMT